MESGPRALPRLAIPALTVLILARLLLQVAVITQYGYFRDELYYIASTDHLGWGYVDHPPLSIAILAIVRAVFGDSLIAVRALPALVGAATVMLTALIARQLGGGRFAQGLAALSVAISPVFLGTAHYYSMNVFDQFAWPLAALVLLRALHEGRPLHWLILGVTIGLGLLNKISVAWLGAGIVIGLVLTRHRGVLRRSWPWIAALLAVAIGLPYVLWNALHDWPTLEFMRNATSMKMVDVSPAGFVRDQILTVGPGAAPVWLAGLVFGLFGRERSRGGVVVLIYVSVFALLLAAGRSRASYLAPAYPALLALGAVAIERVSSRAGLGWLRPSVTTLVAGVGLIAMPMALPILPVETFVRYQTALGMAPKTEERLEMGALPQQYADMFGWPEMTTLVARAYDRLTPDERLRCRVFGQNYGEAGAIDVLGRRLGLPHALSGHNSYWLWGLQGDPPDVVIIIGGDRDGNAKFFEEIEIVGQTSSQWSMPYERGLDVSIGRRPKMSLRDAWPQLKKFW